MNRTDEKYIKCINFDLDTKQLLKIFPNGTREPYALIKKFFEDRRFEHRQYSGYISRGNPKVCQTRHCSKKLRYARFSWQNRGNPRANCHCEVVAFRHNEANRKSVIARESVRILVAIYYAVIAKQ